MSAAGALPVADREMPRGQRPAPPAPDLDTALPSGTTEAEHDTQPDGPALPAMAGRSHPASAARRRSPVYPPGPARGRAAGAGPPPSGQAAGPVRQPARCA